MLRDQTGGQYSPDEATTTIAYNTDGTINTITAVFNGGTWVKTFTYTSGKLTGISKWVKS